MAGEHRAWVRQGETIYAQHGTRQRNELNRAHIAEAQGHPAESIIGQSSKPNRSRWSTSCSTGVTS